MALPKPGSGTRRKRSSSDEPGEVVARPPGRPPGRGHQVAILLTVLIAPLTALEAGDAPHEAYRDLVLLSCTRHDDAVRALSDWSHEEIEDAVAVLSECEALSASDSASDGSRPAAEEACAGVGASTAWAAAAALHTSRALTWPSETESRFHLAVAAAQQERLQDEAFRRRFSLTAGLGSLYLQEYEGARGFLEDGLERFDADPELLVALGASREAEARRRRTLPPQAEIERPSRMLDRAPEETERLRLLHEAAESYEAALSVDSGMGEAHLRLGRVQLLLNRPQEGLVHLRWVTRNSRERDLVYLAHLFIGGHQMESGEGEAALVSYRAALETDPGGQAASVATSSALHHAGDRAAAAEVLERGLATRRRTRASDAWWRYPEGRRGQLPRLLRRLRQEACR